MTLEQSKRHVSPGGGHLEGLYQLGLTDGDVQLVLTNRFKRIRDSDEGHVSGNVKRFCHSSMENEVDTERLRIAEEKFSTYVRALAAARTSKHVSVYSPGSSSSSNLDETVISSLGRFNADNRDSGESKTISSTTLSDPMDRLSEIWKEVAESRGIKLEGKRARRRKKKAERQHVIDQSTLVVSEDSESGEQAEVAGCLTLEDSIRYRSFTEPLVEQNKGSNSALPHPSRCDNDSDLTLDSNSCRTKCGVDESETDFSTDVGCIDSKHSTDYLSKLRSIEEIPAEIIERHRISVQEIREIGRFKNYEPGQPSNVLYLKNLSTRVTEADLRAMFTRFEEPTLPPINYKLLRGRMRGQAFITFPSIEKATDAMNLVNGYDFKGKHMIILYGKGIG